MLLHTRTIIMNQRPSLIDRNMQIMIPHIRRRGRHAHFQSGRPIRNLYTTTAASTSTYTTAQRYQRTARVYVLVPAGVGHHGVGEVPPGCGAGLRVGGGVEAVGGLGWGLEGGHVEGGRGG